MLDLPMDIETRAFVLSFLGAFLGLLAARAVCLVGQRLAEHRNGARHARARSPTLPTRL